MYKYLFSIKVHAPSKEGAIKTFQDWNLGPTDMDIAELTDENGKPCYSVIGFYPETNQKYNGEHFASCHEEAEEQALSTLQVALKKLRNRP